MVIHHIIGPAGCGKTTHLERLAHQARIRQLDCIVARGGETLKNLQARLNHAGAGVVVCIDEDIFGADLDLNALRFPGYAQVFVASTGPRNVWHGVESLKFFQTITTLTTPKA